MGIPVDILNRWETMERLDDWLKVPISRPRMIVTAYSEFFVYAQNDPEFSRVIKKADLITPDGVSVLAAVKYMKAAKQKTLLGKIAEGIKIGGEILAGRVGETVTGVWLFSELTKVAEKKGWKIFLLGGWGDVSARTAEMLLKRFPRLRVEYDSGEARVGTDKATDGRVVKKINAFKPDILFVAYNPVKQEKWIASHLSQLKVGVAVGVGGTFNEYLGEFKKAPEWMERMGLKWLWRVILEPRRIGRILRGVIVFPWLVFRSSL
ncbi:MAG: Glycosyl transferase, WecB/TagA/CpsF family [Candidatus Collierbacteria bacterium GW2011_GWC2_43_12]|uniref:Glycosyl transferase, WecB/TagA/CpsF family n=1 Tax=Candidatus Collierbacteria bacterium GW2011_GWC2_43_12 TaxID=1618390 RepID=A0A0G1D283_9BACT|nr:MAG: Glycosyl transferase, WecB/TagA/CpsF family [Candidatus Collierbacteria bacterium GW2011_GWC2_43_12]KKT83147.1 MAG: Glycosyl transferase, WecB/TagA/CpsF family [Microgenomates group bacterium GW2011_GWC1_44_9]